MDQITILLLVIILLLAVFLFYCLFFFLPSKQKEKNSELSQKIAQDLKLNEEKLSSLLENIKGEIENQKEKNKDLSDKIALSLDKNETLIRLRLENLSSEMKNSIVQPLTKINNVLLHPRERGKLGNLQLDQLLSLYLPKNGKVYQLEFTLKKKRTNGEGLRVDAIVFGVDGKNNLAIDSKFPLENYLMLYKEDLSDIERKEIEKNFKNNLKEHIKKVAEYVSEIDGTDHAIMFVPSEVVFAKINERNFYEIIELALEKKVTICSPMLLAVVINHILWTNKTWEQYRNVDKIITELDSF
jgi:DNA recombination protein RmuC